MGEGESGRPGAWRATLQIPNSSHAVRSVARFRLRVHTLRVEQVSWDDTVPPTCDFCGAHHDVQDDQHVAPYLPAIHHVQSFHVISFMNQNNPGCSYPSCSAERFP
eukprot:1090953-Pelagomonas_calceolata.AAC.1